MPRASGLRRPFCKLDPHQIRLEFTLQKAGGEMLDIIDVVGLGMLLDKRPYARLHIAARIGNNLSRNARFFNGFLQLLVDDLSVGLLNHNQRNRLHVGMSEDVVFPGSVPRRKTQPQHTQAFHRTGLDRKVHDPNPIIGDLLGPGELVIAHPQQPKTMAAPGRNRRRKRKKQVENLQNLLYPTQAYPRRYLKKKGQRNQTQAVRMLPGTDRKARR